MKYRHPPSLLFPYFLPFLPPSPCPLILTPSFLTFSKFSSFSVFIPPPSSFLLTNSLLSFPLRSFFHTSSLVVLLSFFLTLLPFPTCVLFPPPFSTSSSCPLSSSHFLLVFLPLTSSLPLLLSFLPPLTLFSSRLSLFLPHFSPLFPDLHSPRVSSPCSRVT